MKKILVAILSFTLILTLSACGGSDKETSSEDTSSKANDNLTAFEYYEEAVKKFDEADSYDVDSDSKLRIKAPEYDMDMSMGGNIKMSGVDGDDVTAIFDLYSKMPTGEDVMKGFYVDGYSYSELDGNKGKVKTDFSEIRDQMNISPTKLTSDMIEDQSIEEITDAKELHLKLKADTISDIKFGMIGDATKIVEEAFKVGGEITLKTISFVATINDDVELTNIMLAANYDIAADGETGTVSVTYTEKFNQIGGVKMDIPKDLSEYKEK